jgi:peroxiredoxin
MALLQSQHFAMGTIAPDFNLLNTASEKIESLQNLKGINGTIVAFICNHCPFVIHVNNAMVRLANDYAEKGINFVGISSNDADSYPEDGPANMKQLALKFKYSFPYLYDETQEVAKAYNAVCTPDFYVFDADLKAVYHGQLDNARPGNGIPVTCTDIRNALDILLQNEVNNAVQKPSIGCSIKWKK